MAADEPDPEHVARRSSLAQRTQHRMRIVAPDGVAHVHRCTGVRGRVSVHSILPSTFVEECVRSCHVRRRRRLGRRGNGPCDVRRPATGRMIPSWPCAGNSTRPSSWAVPLCPGQRSTRSPRAEASWLNQSMGRAPPQATTRASASSCGCPKMAPHSRLGSRSSSSRRAAPTGSWSMGLTTGRSIVGLPSVLSGRRPVTMPGSPHRPAGRRSTVPACT